jgi:hypothetical protein
MGFRDRFFTPTTAKAILSWRILLGIGVGVATGIAGLVLPVAIAIGAGVYAGSVLASMPRPAKPSQIDPFVLGEPWRQLVQSSQSAARRLQTTIAGIGDGPLKTRLQSIAGQIDAAIHQGWEIARRGDEIDDAVRALDPPTLRSKLATLEHRQATAPSADTDAAIDSVRGQIETSDRLKQQSQQTAERLRLTQTRIDELVARASEVKLGATDTDRYAHDVDEVVIQLEALRQAVEETRSQ